MNTGTNILEMNTNLKRKKAVTTEGYGKHYLQLYFRKHSYQSLLFTSQISILIEYHIFDKNITTKEFFLRNIETATELKISAAGF